jgi:prephenate dehydratase
MTISIAHLGPPGTYAEAAAIAYANKLTLMGQQSRLCPYPSIAQTLRAAAEGLANLAVAPVENSIEGSVTMTLDTLWQLDNLKIQQELVLPISHALISLASKVEEIKTVYSHPQALAQCQNWLERYLPKVQLIPTNSTTEALQHLEGEQSSGAIASQRAAELYNLPILEFPINDNPDNCTRFWILRNESRIDTNKLINEEKEFLDNSRKLMDFKSDRSYTSLAFSVPANLPGTLVKPLKVFADRNINLTKIESRPTKKSLGDYLFFIDLEADVNQDVVKEALEELTAYTESLKIFGCYKILAMD